MSETRGTGLADLKPRFRPCADGTTFLAFLCPKCRKHEIAIDIWGGGAAVVQLGTREDGKPIIKRVWHAEQGPHYDLATLTVTPSIARETCGDPCGGWHGYITNGVAA